MKRLGYVDRDLLYISGILAGCVALLVWSLMSLDASLTKRCAALLTYAHTSRDTLDARIACEKMKSDAATSVAIGAASGAAVGAAASPPVYRGR